MTNRPRLTPKTVFVRKLEKGWLLEIEGSDQNFTVKTLRELKTWKEGRELYCGEKITLKRL